MWRRETLHMKRFRPLPLLTTATFLLLTAGMPAAQAQPPGDPMFDGGPLFDEDFDGHRPPPGGHGPGAKGHLDGFLHGVQRLKGSSSDVSKAQAQKMVTLIQPWSKRATMSDADAHKLVTSLEAVLTSAQKSKFGPPGRGGPPRGRDGGRFGPPPGEEGGPPPERDFGPPPGQGRGMGAERMALPVSFNPFYSPTGRSDWKKLPSSTQQLLARRYRENRAVLERLSRRIKI